MCGGGQPEVCRQTLGTPGEIATTPRADENIELLALDLSGGITADGSLYNRLVRDIREIKEIKPEVRGIDYEPAHDGKSLMVSFDEKTIPKVQAGDYKTWDCLNTHYGLRRIDPPAKSAPYALVTLKGIYDLEIVRKSYAALPGVISASPNYFTSTLDIRSGMKAVLDNGVLHYIYAVVPVDRTGPWQRTLFYFMADEVNLPKLVDAAPEVGIAGATAAPRWMRQYWFGSEALHTFGIDVE